MSELGGSIDAVNKYRCVHQSLDEVMIAPFSDCLSFGRFVEVDIIQIV